MRQSRIATTPMLSTSLYNINIGILWANIPSKFKVTMRFNWSVPSIGKQSEAASVGGGLAAYRLAIGF